MKGKINKNPQLNVFRVPLVSVINMEHEIVILAKSIDWASVEKEFSIYYPNLGRPAVPIRKMVGSMLLKQMYNLGDETFVARWIENPYWQYFCGETYFQYDKPYDPSEFVHFRKRIGEVGAQKILKLSISLFDSREVHEKEVLIDTTVQEKNITFPTDSKLHKKIIEGCRKISKKEGIKLRQSYTRTVKQLMIEQKFRDHPKKRKKANAAARKLKTIAGQLVRDVERSLDDIDRLSYYDEQLWLYYRVLGQKRDDKNKIYSFHAPEVKCISKGKEHKKYEFGNKSSFVLTKKSGIVVGAMAFEDNIYDGHTIEPQLAQVEDLLGRLHETALVDRGCKGRKNIMGVTIKIPGSGRGKTAYQKAKERERFRRRASIEPIIGHLKQEHRVLRNYLKGVEGDMINTLLAGAAFNMMKMLRKIRESIISVLNKLVEKLTRNYLVLINY
ncbi:MAG TPA: IS5 family transposase [Bacteroidales bacterium]|nr:IS5 family transposase [Bacteroidales bacterium]